MLREDKSARMELIKGKPGRPWRGAEPDVYEFSVGKYTASGNLARSYNYVRLAAGEERFFQAQKQVPVRVMVNSGTQWWWYLDRFYRDPDGLSAADVQALVLQREQKKLATLERARTEVFGGVNIEVADPSKPRREPIPESVRHEVWRRDQGRCVDCGSRENLEFDHTIPVSKGGSSTARNIELRCETCNRSKGARI